MSKIKLPKTNTTSENLEPDNLEKLRSIFPQFVKDGQVDFDSLKAFFEKEGMLPEGQEKYGLSWAGKSKAFQNIKSPATGTLVPDEKESKDFENTENIFIEGDNLEVLKLLQKHYREKIKMIYIDPPYNTGKDFIYKDNFKENVSDYYERTGQSENGIKLTSNPESAGRYHSDWLTMMYPRLFLARNLLKDDGVIFISIDDNEVANLRMIMDEIFGEENFVADLVWQKKTGASDANTIATITEYILVYSKNLELSFSSFERNKLSYDLKRYKLKDDHFEERGNYYIDNLDRGGLQYSDSLNYPIKCPDGSFTYPNGRKEHIREGWIWKWSKKKVEWAIENDFIEFRKSRGKESGWAVCYKNYLKVDNENQDIERSAPVKNLILDVLNANSAADMKELFETSIFPYSKPVALIKRLISYIKFEDNDFILDFFAGSGTTAHAVMDLNAEDGGNRKWICVQLPEGTDENSEARKAGFQNIARIARERIRRAGKKIAANCHSKLDLESKGELDTGFKSYILSNSNYRQWNVLTDQNDEKELLKQSKLTLEKPLVDNFDEKAVVYEILLKEGFDLNSQVNLPPATAKRTFPAGEKEQGASLHNSLSFWVITSCHSELDSDSRKLVISFTSKITQEQVDLLDLAEGDTFVCLDSALNDTTKVNIVRRKFKVKVI